MITGVFAASPGPMATALQAGLREKEMTAGAAISRLPR
jgi:hypothetical protein